MPETHKAQAKNIDWQICDIRTPTDTNAISGQLARATGVGTQVQAARNELLVTLEGIAAAKTTFQKFASTGLSMATCLVCGVDLGRGHCELSWCERDMHTPLQGKRKTGRRDKASATSEISAVGECPERDKFVYVCAYVPVSATAHYANARVYARVRNNCVNCCCGEGSAAH